MKEQCEFDGRMTGGKCSAIFCNSEKKCDSKYKNGTVKYLYPLKVRLEKITKKKGFKACWALENLQPLWKQDNLSKHNKILS